YTITNQGGKVPVNNYRLTVILPDGAEYIAGSSLLAGRAIADPNVNGTILVYRLGDLPADWDRSLQFRAGVQASPASKLISRAAAVLDAGDDKDLRIPPVETVALVSGSAAEPKRYVFQPQFGTLNAELSTADKRELDTLIPQLLGLQIRSITVVGHTDDVPISAASQKKFADNYALSQARAQTVAQYLQQTLDLPATIVSARGLGPDQPVATNDTVAGRAKNRRTEIIIDAVTVSGPDISTMVEPESTVSSVQVQGGSAGQQPVVSNIKRPPSAVLSIEQFDERWLESTNPGVEWLMPAADFVPAIPAVNIAIKHRPGDTVSARLNGQPLNPLFYFGLKKNTRGSVARSYWQGVHLQTGDNIFEFTVRGLDGAETTLARSVHYSDAPLRAELVEEYSYLIADGKTPPVLAVRFYDRWNKPVRPGVIGGFAVLPPYQSKERLNAMEEDLLSAFDRTQPLYEIEERGIAYIELEPTAQTGKAVLEFNFNSGKRQKIESWLKPAPREWIVVGMADAVIGDNGISGNSATAETATTLEEGNYNDGKLAFFAKGNLNDDWLLTASADSSREQDTIGNGLFQTVDPDEFFTLYGDSTEQRYEAPSADKMFLKLERDRFYALYGDYETGLNVTELSKYTRNVTGLKSEYQGSLFSFNGFAAETTQRFARDEIRGNGTSGLYRLSRSDIVLNSETIVIEIRDRFHSQDVLEQRSLRRHYDYNIDYRAGTVFFREPVTSRDQNFNPVFIVVDYETETDIEGDVTGGARGALNLLDSRLELGFSGISDGTFAQNGELYGMDALLKVSDRSELKIEYADSEVDDAGVLRAGGAYLAELSTHGEKLDGRIYMREQESGFGLGQQAGGESGTSKQGVDGSYRLTPSLSLNSEVFHEENLVTDAERNVAEVDANYAFGRHTLSAGYRTAEDELGNGQSNESELLLLGGSSRLYDNKLNLRLNSELALGSNDANPAYPTRHIAGADYFWTPNINSYVEQELTEGEYRDTSSTRIGVQARPWEQARLDTRVEQNYGEYGPRTFAVMGLTQGFRLNDRWSADISVDRSKTLNGTAEPQFNLNVPPVSGSFNEDFTAVSLGGTRRGVQSTLVSRIEQRDADSEDRLGLMLGWHRDVQAGIAYGFDTRLFDSEFRNGATASEGDIRYSLAYRPVTSEWIHLNRLEYKFNETLDTLGTETRTRKLINNWKGNYMPQRAHQLSLGYGVKYTLANFDGAEYDGITQYVGSEYRYDISEHWDLGLGGSRLLSANADTDLYSYGISTGWNLVKDLWLSVGYNFDGFRDEDFSLAEYTAKGAYLKLRFKFDQDSLQLNK
ncbi:MAG TPA: OmpA family protein, partial [Gammaproteobacteria bacterium]